MASICVPFGGGAGAGAVRAAKGSCTFAAGTPPVAAMNAAIAVMGSPSKAGSAATGPPEGATKG